MYIVEIEHRSHDIFIAKFYLKSHRHSDNRYTLTLDAHQRKPNHSGAQNCLKILNTLMMISGVILRNNANASFGFIGAPRFIEMDTELNAPNINEDGTFGNTVRFRVYKNYVLRYFSPTKFQHIEFVNSSAYLIKNMKNKELSKSVVETELHKYINGV